MHAVCAAYIFIPFIFIQYNFSIFFNFSHLLAFHRTILFNAMNVHFLYTDQLPRSIVGGLAFKIETKLFHAKIIITFPNVLHMCWRSTASDMRDKTRKGRKWKRSNKTITGKKKLCRPLVRDINRCLPRTSSLYSQLN